MSQGNVEIAREIVEFFNDRGPAAVDRLRELFADDVHIDARDRVVVVETRRGRARISGTEVEQRSSTIWTLRGAQVTHMETDVVPEPALKAVGLSE